MGKSQSPRLVMWPLLNTRPDTRWTSNAPGWSRRLIHSRRSSSTSILILTWKVGNASKSNQSVLVENGCHNWLISDCLSVCVLFSWHLLLTWIGKDWIRQLIYLKPGLVFQHWHFSSSFSTSGLLIRSLVSQNIYLASKQISLALRSWGVPPVGWKWKITYKLNLGGELDLFKNKRPALW